MLTKTIVFCLALLSLLLVACSGGKDEKPSATPAPERLDVSIGVFQSLTGSAAVYGKSGVEGVELAIKEFETAYPTIHISYSIVDDQSSPDEGVKVVSTFGSKKVTAIIGPSLSNVGFPALKAAQDASIPAVSPMTTASGIGAIGDYVFRIALAEEASVPLLVAEVNRRTPIREAVLFFDSADAYSRSTAEAMRKGIATAGGKVTMEVDLESITDLAGVLNDARLRSAQAFLLPTITETAAPVLKALRVAGLQQPAIGGEALATADLPRLAGAAADGTYVASTWHPDETSDLSRRFVASYRQAYGHAPEHFAAESYTAVYVLVDALRRAGTTAAPALRDALAATRNFDTVLGSLSMDSQGDAVFKPVFQQFRSGQLVILQ